ncbi:MAG: hypothetical protein NVS9B1_00880 [Candidatus Dormibacteraceae bacterium]
MAEFLWVIVVAIAVVLLMAIIARFFTTRRARPTFTVRSLPGSHLGVYRARMTEVQAMFVDSPREAVAGAKQIVDDLTTRVGYPTRLTDQERLADLASVDPSQADRYRRGLALKPESTTEELRRALQSYLDLGRAILDRATRKAGDERDDRPEIAG